jgi:hypothetical protein
VAVRRQRVKELSYLLICHIILHVENLASGALSNIQYSEMNKGVETRFISILRWQSLGALTEMGLTERATLKRFVWPNLVGVSNSFTGEWKQI